MTIATESRARVVGALVILALGAWTLHSFLGLLLWAVVLGITTWPVFAWLAGPSGPQWFRGRPVLVAAVLTIVMGLSILAPLTYGVTRLLHETQSLVHWLGEATRVGSPAPDWLEGLPGVGPKLAEQWTEMLGTADAARETLHGLGTSSVLAYTKAFASQIAHRLFAFLMILVVLFVLYVHGEGLSRQLLAGGKRLFGEAGIRYAEHAVAAVRATVNGLVLVALGEGLLLGLGYAAVGIGHPAVLGALTGAAALIPFAAKLVFGGCAAVLLVQGQIGAGVGLFVYGLIILLLADNVVRPRLIGSGAKLPFLWTLLGILGGLENFGMLGVFLGPTIMAVLMSVWRDWNDGQTDAD